MRRLVALTPGLSEQGGAAKHASLLLNGLARNEWEIRAVTRSGTTRRFRTIRRGSLLAVEVPGFGSRRLGAVLYMIVAFPLAVLWGRRARVVIGFQLMSPTSVASGVAALLRRPFVAFGITDGELAEIRNAPLSRLRFALIRRAALLVAQTQPMALEMAQIVPEDRVLVLPTPVVIEEPLPLTGRPLAMFSGRMSKHKGLTALLAAWLGVLRHLPEARLTLVGAGGEFDSAEDELKRTVAGDLDLAASVRFTGWVNDVSPYLSEADVFVLPSQREGMSNALLEACVAGRIVVASDIPPNRAVLGDDYPLLFAVGNKEQLTERLLMAFTDTTIRERARRHVISRSAVSSVEKVVGRLDEVLSRLGGENTP